jgi:aryl-alcohol dehydrogenase-like predicted oxidoreductase
VISFFSLASGFLTGKYRSEEDFGKSPRGPWHISKYLNDRGRRILGALDKISKVKGVPQTQVALAWLMARPGLTAPIASASRVNQIADLVAATQLKLSNSDIRELDTASAY